MLLVAILHKCILTWPTDQTHPNDVILEDKTSKNQSKKKKVVQLPIFHLTVHSKVNIFIQHLLQAPGTLLSTLHTFYHHRHSNSRGEMLSLFSLNR